MADTRITDFGVEWVARPPPPDLRITDFGVEWIARVPTSGAVRITDFGVEWIARPPAGGGGTGIEFDALPASIAITGEEADFEFSADARVSQTVAESAIDQDETEARARFSQGVVEAAIDQDQTDARARLSQTILEVVIDAIVVPPVVVENVPIACECDPATAFGELVTPYDWPVIERRLGIKDEFEFESGHRRTSLRYPFIRRIFEIHADAMTTAERDYLLTFWIAHKGIEIAFDWKPPYESVAICVHFKDDRLGTALRNPGIHRFSFVLEQLAPCA